MGELRGCSDGESQGSVIRGFQCVHAGSKAHGHFCSEPVAF